MAIRSNLTIDQGSDYSITVDLVSANGDPMNLSGYTGRSQLRKHPDSVNSKEFTVEVANSGSIILSMDSVYTANITAGRYMYDAEIVSSANVVTRVIQGIVTVTPEITR